MEVVVVSIFFFSLVWPKKVVGRKRTRTGEKGRWEKGKMGKSPGLAELSFLIC